MGSFRPASPIRMRVTRLDDCGVPAYDDDCTYYVRNCTVSATWEDQVEDPQEYLMRCDDDVLQFYKRTRPTYKFAQASLSINDIDPLLLQLMMGFDVETDAQTLDPVGGRLNAATFGATKFAFEFWTEMAPSPNQALCAGADGRWAYLLFPFGINGRWSTAPTFGNGTDAMVIQWDAMIGGSWEDGPFDVVADALGEPAPLTDPMQPSQVYLMRETSVAPPALTDGCVVLSSPTSPTSP